MLLWLTRLLFKILPSIVNVITTGSEKYHWVSYDDLKEIRGFLLLRICNKTTQNATPEILIALQRLFFLFSIRCDIDSFANILCPFVTETFLNFTLAGLV